jgi:hypothetical protein
MAIDGSTRASASGTIERRIRIETKTTAKSLKSLKAECLAIFFVSRGQLFRQIVGIAMGSPGIYSPAAAILGCMDDLLSFVLDFKKRHRHGQCAKHPS